MKTAATVAIPLLMEVAVGATRISPVALLATGERAAAAGAAAAVEVVGAQAALLREWTANPLAKGGCCLTIELIFQNEHS